MPHRDSGEFCWTPATEIAELVRNGEVSPSEVAAACIERVEAVNPELNALIEFDADQVRSRAERLSSAVAAGEDLGPLHGVPFTLKEHCRLEGTVETFGMTPMKGSVSTETEAVARRLLDAGGLFLGKTNMAEAGYCARGGNQLYGDTHNPWDLGKNTGGSSAGAGAAAAAGLGQLALGSDGAGSVRIPAAMNGLVGLKPGFGRIPESIAPPRYRTFLGYGPMTRTVADAALMLDVLAGPDPSDPLSLPNDGSQFARAASEEIGKLRIAWSPNLGFEEFVDPEILGICERAVGAFEELGCSVDAADPGWENPELGMWRGFHAAAYASAYGTLNWDEYAGQIDEQFVQVMREGTQISAVDIGLADDARGLMWDQFSAFMGEYDLLISPTLTTKSFPVDAFCPPALSDQPLHRQLLGWVLTYPTNMLGTPAITVPAGFDSEGMPVGLHIAAPMHGEEALIRAAAAFEAARPWAQHRPSAGRPIDS